MLSRVEHEVFLYTHGLVYALPLYLSSRTVTVSKIQFSFFLHFTYNFRVFYFTLQKKKKVASDLRNKEGDIKLLFATEAYGMGADSPDIRRIVHVGPPNSLESK